MDKPILMLLAKLYECQETAKRFFASEYPDKIKWYREIIQGVMAKKGIDTLPAVLIICEDTTVKENGLALMLFMSAAVDIIEENKNGK